MLRGVFESLSMLTCRDCSVVAVLWLLFLGLGHSGLVWIVLVASLCIL